MHVPPTDGLIGPMLLTVQPVIANLTNLLGDSLTKGISDKVSQRMVEEFAPHLHKGIMKEVGHRCPARSIVIESSAVYRGGRRRCTYIYVLYMNLIESDYIVFDDYAVCPTVDPHFDPSAL